MDRIKSIMVDENCGFAVGSEGHPYITFDGGDTHEGWYHRIYRVRETGLTYEVWDSGGYEKHLEIEEQPATKDKLLSELAAGAVPLTKWTNKPGIELLMSLTGDLPEEEFDDLLSDAGNALRLA